MPLSRSSLNYSSRIPLPESNGSDDTAMLNAFKTRGRMSGRGRTYLVSSSITMGADFWLEDANLLDINPTRASARMLSFNNAGAKFTLANVTLDRSTNRVANTVNVANNAGIYITDATDPEINGLRVINGGSGTCIFIVRSVRPRFFDMEVLDARWDWDTTGIPTSEQIVGIRIGGSVATDGVYDGQIIRPKVRNLTAHITWATGQVFTYGVRVWSGANLYKVTVAGTAGLTAPTHTSGAVTLNGVEYTYVNLWVTATAVTARDIVWNGNNYYQAANSGTTGATAPTHTEGTASDDVVTWIWIGTPDRAFQTDGIDVSGVSGLRMSDGMVSNVWEGIDISGGRNNDRIHLTGMKYHDIDAYGEKWAHKSFRSSSIGSEVMRAGLVGFIVTGGNIEESDAGTGVDLIDSQSFDIGSSGNWTGSIIAGISVGGTAPLAPIGTRIINPRISDRQTRLCTLTLASPTVITCAAHGKSVGAATFIDTDHSMPTGLRHHRKVFVVSVPTADTLTVSDTKGGPPINATATAWVTATSYIDGDVRSNGGLLYQALIAHTSGTFATDLAAGKWVLSQFFLSMPTMQYGIRNEPNNPVKVSNAEILGVTIGQYAGVGEFEINDFEEGTWTPTFTAATNPPTGVTYSSQLGWYTRKGTEVTVGCHIVLTSKGTGGAGTALIQGIPYPVRNLNAYGGAAKSESLDFPAGKPVIGALAMANTSNVQVETFGDNVPSAFSTWIDFTDTARLRFTITYQTDAASIA